MYLLKHVLIATALLLASVGHADTVMTFRESVSVGENETVTKVEVWVGADSIARVGGNVRMLIDNPGDEVFLIDDESRTVRAIPVIVMDRATPVVVETEMTMEISGWPAARYDVEIESVPGQKMVVAIWMSEVTGMDRESFLTYLKATDQGLGLADVIAALPGIPVLLELESGPVKSHVELLSVDDAAAKEGVYDIPDDYVFQ